MEISRQGYWSGFPFPSSGDLPDPEIKLGSPTLQAHTLPSELPLSQVRKSKTHLFTKEVGLKLQFSQMKQIRLTWLEGQTLYLQKKEFLITLDKPISKLFYPLYNLHFKNTAEIRIQGRPERISASQRYRQVLPRMTLFLLCLVFTSFITWTGKVLGVVKGLLEPPFWSCKDYICKPRIVLFSPPCPKELGAPHNWMASFVRSPISGPQVAYLLEKRRT